MGGVGSYPTSETMWYIWEAWVRTPLLKPCGIWQAAFSVLDIRLIAIFNKLDWEAHINDLITKANKRLYYLCQLKRSELRKSDLLQSYKALTVVEYVCQSWSASLNSGAISRLKYIYVYSKESIDPWRSRSTQSAHLRTTKGATVKDTVPSHHSRHRAHISQAHVRQ